MITLNITDHLEQRKISYNDSGHATSHDTQMNYSIQEETDTDQETRHSSENINKHHSDSFIRQEFNQEEDEAENKCAEDTVNTVQCLEISSDVRKASVIDQSVVECCDEATDSDSGIYSLYDSVILTHHQTWDQSSETLQQDQDRRHFLSDAFHEARSLARLMSGFTEMPYLKLEEEMIQNIKDRQDSLRKYLTRIEIEKVETNESINTLKHKIFQQNTNQFFLTKFQTIMDQIDQITNLIFGIEMKIEKCSYNEFNIINSELWRWKLAEAVEIKNRHNESLNKLIQDNLSSGDQMELQERICAKQKQICQIRLIKAEIYCSEMQLKLIFM